MQLCSVSNGINQITDCGGCCVSLGLTGNRLELIRQLVQLHPAIALQIKRQHRTGEDNLLFFQFNIVGTNIHCIVKYLQQVTFPMHSAGFDSKNSCFTLFNLLIGTGIGHHLTAVFTVKNNRRNKVIVLSSNIQCSTILVIGNLADHRSSFIDHRCDAECCTLSSRLTFTKSSLHIVFRQHGQRQFQHIVFLNRRQ